jgi:hypothetical protein
MRLAFALALLATTAVAHAESVPIAIAPFAGRCFDAAALAERVRTHVDSTVTVGAAARGASHQEVRVAEHAGALTVQVTARDAHNAIVGSARHMVPADDCAAALEVTSLIVARAALPLTAVEPRAPHPPRPRPTPPPPPTEAPPPEKPPEPAPAPTPPPPPPKPQVIIIEKPVPVPVPTPTPVPSGSVMVRMRPPDKRWLGELWAAVYGAFALDGNGADLPAGELGLGFRRGHFGAAVRGAVEGDYRVASTQPGIALDIRRAQIALEAHADVPIRVGALRFVLGPTMPLWSARPTGLAHPTTHVIVSAGLTARLFYHLDIGRVFIAAGVNFDAAFLREELTLTGIGPIARTPLFEVGPILVFGVNL